MTVFYFSKFQKNMKFKFKKYLIKKKEKNRLIQKFVNLFVFTYLKRVAISLSRFIHVLFKTR